MSTFAELLNALFTTHTHSNGRPYTNVEVSRALDGAVHAAHISKLRIGQIQNPERTTIMHLAHFFHVAPDYFFPELATLSINEDMYTLLLIHTLDVWTIQELVNKLYQLSRRADGREFTDRDVSRGVDHALHPSYLGKLRNGHIENPSRDTLLHLCRFFHVPPDYFFPECREAHRTFLLRSLDTNNPHILRALTRIFKAAQSREE